jgi:agmatinase
LRLLISRTHLVGLDLVEVSPPYDVAGVTTTLAARLVLDAMGFAMAKREKSEL